MLNYDGSQAVYLVRAESVRFRKADRLKPELRNLVTVLDVDMRRLRSFHAVEEEAETVKPQDCWHRATLQTIIRIRSARFNVAGLLRAGGERPKNDSRPIG
jgi:hypothetical protein